ncbi:deoxyribodipyrimidine photo-lyase family protein (cryptochrome) [Nonlabens sp. Hel1_33_55]|uniref:cryptochrome/deoxyribodipyrimidine photo-lyase family protein n=1 Tax=Nonlabens sp. Hel1_33_55 TaxID=1336802 RepID=UPI000875B924|nr:FAD-binding domain-containing protein [Nonlabens sp. Hel1_33_55]SCX91051.1 deoxyribodipyrimidine photo-lyase family protein (cryptochrome) [Nonlabens sp. Hel1_33_55]
MSTSSINIYWFKRDLRLSDLEGLKALESDTIPLLLVYIYEPSIWQNAHYSSRHSDFVKQSIADLNTQLEPFNQEILTVESEAPAFFEKLSQLVNIKSIHSSMETGLDLTYSRDLALKDYFNNEDIVWNEYQTNGVFRGINNRDTWSKDWYNYMNRSLCDVDLNKFAFAKAEQFSNHVNLLNLETSTEVFQIGGESQSKLWADSFFNHRLKFYSSFISKPLQSRMGCSRLSPYISWGNVSIRQLYQGAKKLKEHTTHKKSLNAFNSRLRWQSHFIQKFEQEPRMEFESINKGYLELHQTYNEEFVTAWKEGKTGYPLVDASMRAVKQTGYINFRMRCLVTSFLCHHLFQHFTTGSAFLAAQFLDWEPGIHYGQFQMQAGLTGTNTLRIYNPTKGAHDHDPDALFIKYYVTELSHLPPRYAIEPWLAEEELHEYDFNYGVDYPRRIVDITETRKQALEKIYGLRKNPLTQSEKKRILATHSMKRRMA